MSFIPHLVEFHEKYGPQGLVILAITSNPKSEIEKFAQEKGIKYRVGFDEKGEASQTYGVTGIPASWLLDAEGNVIYKGHPASLATSMIEDELKKIEVVKLRDVVAALAPAKADFEKKKYGDAWAKADKVLKNAKAPEADKTDAQYIQDEVKKHAEEALASIDPMVANSQFTKAIQKLKDLASQLKGTEWEKAAKDKQKTVESDPKAKKEIEAQKVLDGLLTQEKAIKKGKDKKKWLPNLLGFVKKYEGTQAAVAAERRIDQINKMGD